MITNNVVLLLKAAAGSEEEDKYEKLLKLNNLMVAHVNTLTFQFKNIDILMKRLLDSDDYTGIIFSSTRCVSAVKLAVGNDKMLLDKWKSKSILAVGEATWKFAETHLGLECDGKESGNSVNLAKHIIENKDQFKKPFLFPHGNLKTDILKQELNKEGLELEGVEVYNTLPNPNLETELAEVTDNFTKLPEFLVFFSPSGFNATIPFLKKVPVDISLAKIVAIGPVTETTIKESNLQLYGVAKKPNPEEVLNVILNKA